MALALFETQEQSLDRERRKFRTHVDSEVQRFERAQEEMQARRVREEEDAERERQQGIAFQRQRFTELVTPTLDQYADDFNAERDRIDGEREKFRGLIKPRLEKEQGRIEGIENERAKFAETVGPSLEELRTPTVTAIPTSQPQPPDLLGQAPATPIPSPTPTATPIAVSDDARPDSFVGGPQRAIGGLKFRNDRKRVIDQAIDLAVAEIPSQSATALPAVVPRALEVAPEIVDIVDRYISGPQRRLPDADEVVLVMKGTRIPEVVPEPGVPQPVPTPRYPTPEDEPAHLPAWVDDLFKSVLPQEVNDLIRKIPYVGEHLERNLDFWTSPTGIGILIGTFGAGAAIGGLGTGARLAAAGPVGDIVGGGVGRLLETQAGVDPVDVGPFSVGPRGVGEVAGGVAADVLALRGTGALRRAQTLEEPPAGPGTFPGPDDAGPPALRPEEPPTVPSVVDDLPSPAERLTQWMSESEGSFQQTLKERAGTISESRSAKSARMAEIFADESLTPQRQFEQATSALKGADAPDSTFARAPMNEADVSELLTTVRDHPLLQARVFERRNTQSALLKLLDGDLPTAGEWKLLERVFGPDFVRAGMRQDQKSWRVVADLLNLPRTLRTIFDHSWPLRQGIGAIARHPKEVIGNLPQGLWSMVSKRSFRQWDEALRSKSQVLHVTDEAGSTRPWTIAELQDDSKLFLPKMQEVTGELAERTEEFLPTQGDSWVGRFFGPVVEPFQRSFLGHGNMARSDIFENTLRGWTNGFTETIPRNDVDGLAWLLNVATGRGDLSGFNKYSPFLAGGIFSPRLVAARVEHALSPALLAAGKLGVPQSGRAASLAAQQLISFVGAGISILAVASAAGVARVETSPLSTLWGKLELFRDPDNPGGATQKIDLFGGYQQYARTIAQLFEAKSKSDLGVISDRDRIQILEQFALNKLAPVPSLARGAVYGETTIGKDVDLESIAGIKDFLWDGLSPLSFNDIEEAISQQDDLWKIAIGAGTAGTFGELGASANTYAPRVTQQLAAIPEYKGLTAQQVSSMKDLISLAEREVSRAGIEQGVKLSMAGAIRGQGADGNYDPDVIKMAVAIQSTSMREKLRNPEWVSFAVENLEELRASGSKRWEDPPNYIVDLWRKSQGLSEVR